MEIERKWLLSKIPEQFEGTRGELSRQGYISINPEVRIRESEDILGKLKYVLCIKGSGSKKRLEIEKDLSKDEFDDLKEEFISDKNLISKITYYLYDKEFDALLEISIVDKDSEGSFIYAEVEFKTEEECDMYELPAVLVEECNMVEVTKDKFYKMKKYWSRTRLGNK